MPVQPKARNGHDSDRRKNLATCPLCDQPADANRMTLILGRERTRADEIERDVEQRFAREMARIEAGRKAEIAEAVRKALKGAEDKVKLLRQQQAGAVAAAVETERKRAGKRMDDAVAAERLAHVTEKARLEAAWPTFSGSSRPEHHSNSASRPRSIYLNVCRARSRPTRSCEYHAAFRVPTCL